MEWVAPNLHMWLTFLIILGAIISYALDRIPLETTSVLTVVALLLLFNLMPLRAASGAEVLDTRDVLAGFADPALFAIIALLIVGQGLIQTGALDGAAQQLMAWGTRRPVTVIACSMTGVAILSAVLNNTPVVVIFIPIMTALAQKLGRTASSVLIPLSYIAILGGNMTLIGSSTNLLVSGALDSATGRTLGFFDFTVPGIIVASIGAIYVMLIVPRLVGKRTGSTFESGQQTGHQFLVQIDVTRGSALEGLTAKSGLFPGLPHITIRSIFRGAQELMRPFDDISLQPGDRLMCLATRKALIDLYTESPALLPSGAVLGNGGEDVSGANMPIVAEVIVAPASRMEGRTLPQSGFHEQSHCAVLGVQRKSRMIRQRLDDIRLEAGDSLLVIGTRRNVLSLRDSRDVLLLEWSAQEFDVSDKSRHALLAFGLVVLTAASGVLPIAVAALGGATLMILMGCINVRQAARAIDRRVVLMVGAALAMGAALEGTGGAHFLAASILGLVEGASPPIILSAFFLLVAALTNVLSNNATAVLFTPIAISVSDTLGVDPMAFVIAVLFAANCSFATPMSYQTNLLVMAPGHYKFSDYLKAGLPLIGLIWIVFSIVAPWYYGF